MKETYKAFSKIIINDYPYKVNQFFNDKSVFLLFEKIFNDLLDQHSKIKNKFYSLNGKGLLNLSYMDHFLILAHRFSSALSKNIRFIELANAIFYSTKIRSSCDIIYSTDIDKYFMPIHPIGTILTPNSKYGKGFMVYQNVSVGPFQVSSNNPDEYKFPKIGNWVRIFSNSKILGDSTIGDNVIIGIGTTIINKNVPNNTTVITTEEGRTLFLPNKINTKKQFFDV
jgi:serine O-acetyltransferase